MHHLHLPDPIAAYFQADRLDAAAVGRCFNPDARVSDEGHTHEGVAAIEAWKADTAARFAYTATPVALEKSGPDHLVTARVAGDFPGSPLDLRYRFTLARGKIASLEIRS